MTALENSAAPAGLCYVHDCEQFFASNPKLSIIILCMIILEPIKLSATVNKTTFWDSRR